MTKHPLGSGPVVARGVTLHPLVCDMLLDTAEELGIDFTVESLGRGTGTDADAVHFAKAGIPCGLISVPLRYMHSSVELASILDIEAAATLIAAFAQKLTPGMSFIR
jgi:putative aminopeptidase FrvX